MRLPNLVPRSGVFVLSLGLLSAAGVNAEPDPRPIILRSHQLFDPDSVVSAQITIRVRNGEGTIRVSAFTVGISREDYAEIVVDFGGNSQSIRLPAHHFPKLDLFEMTVGESRLRDGEAIIVIPFGEPRFECFQNIDGRNELHIALGVGGLDRARVQTYENCAGGYRDARTIIQHSFVAPTAFSN